jgi:hypothetical protein
MRRGLFYQSKGGANRTPFGKKLWRLVILFA